MLDKNELKRFLSYDPETGLFIWNVARGKAAKGSIAGSRDTYGYVIIRLKGIAYKAHRLAFLYMTGDYPVHQIDHIDRDKANNRWGNLADKTASENNRNKACQNSIGLKFVSKAGLRTYRASLRAGGKKVHLGSFGSAREAFDAACAKGRELFGDTFHAE